MTEDDVPFTFELTHGGELSLTEHDDDYQLRIDVGGGHFAIRVSALDVQALRTLTGDIVLARLNEVTPDVQRFMALLDADAEAPE